MTGYGRRHVPRRRDGEAFGGGASAFVLFIPYDVLVQAGDLVAYDENGQVLGR
jgi:hypothetical protein